MKFEINQKVEWSSQSNGGYTTKKGVIAVVIPPRQAMDKYTAGLALKKAGYDIHDIRWMTDFESKRDHESYFVLVQGNDRRMHRVYWPRVSALRPVDG